MSPEAARQEEHQKGAPEGGAGAVAMAAVAAGAASDGLRGLPLKHRC